MDEVIIADLYVFHGTFIVPKNIDGNTLDEVVPITMLTTLVNSCMAELLLA